MAASTAPCATFDFSRGDPLSNLVSSPSEPKITCHPGGVAVVHVGTVCRTRPTALITSGRDIRDQHVRGCGQRELDGGRLVPPSEPLRSDKEEHYARDGYCKPLLGLRYCPRNCPSSAISSKPTPCGRPWARRKSGVRKRFDRNSSSSFGKAHRAPAGTGQGRTG